MKFSDFFHAWLHESYYKNAVSIGKNGDFFTAVSVGNLFGTLLAAKITIQAVKSKPLKFDRTIATLCAKKLVFIYFPFCKFCVIIFFLLKL